MKKAIYPGTFDPITFGHIDLIKKSLNIFDKIIVAVSDGNTKNYLFTAEEREGFDNILSAGYVDVFRRDNPELTGAYTWWTAWGGARARNVGWRIDYWLASENIAESIENPQIHVDQMGSDHCPVSIEVTK